MRQIAVNSLKMGDILGKTIYSSKGRVLLGKGVKLTPLYISKLKEMGVSIVYIEDERFKDVVVEDVISDEQRREALEIIEISSQAISLGKDFNGIELQGIIGKIVEQILFKKDILISMMDMRNKDNHIFAHSVNVCVLATVLGKAMMFDREKLETLSTGALLHDIGIIHFDSTIINNLGSLNPSERELFKDHTTLGFEDLRKKKDISLIAAHIAFQHHETLYGTGYPRGLKEGEIHPLAQIVSLVDMYDRLVSDHSDLKKVNPQEACEVLMGLANNVFPLEYVRIFLRNIAAYPTGVTVKLNTGEIGVVVDQNLSMPTRPIVRVFHEDMEVNKPKEYNLVEKRTIFITEILT